ncbi:peptidoglycan glycosyltransferase [Bacillus sp. SA1-12]|uniref:transglycosylase domain-containing protein n=1 Tax=Bacillus sp. SA1-12 TaxID=1455638 RepID=UPI0006252DD7|nr:transglycosylase domain-containing protein [Bacillus sp. SA1-12]KKI91659.1 peptidoglycan glycosyltransferase [Bacillus sp. SA1-12]
MKKKDEKLRRFSPFMNKDLARSFRISYNVIGNLLLLFLVIGLIGICFAGGVGAGYFASLVKEEPIRSYEALKNDIYNYEETSEIYFANNVYLGKLRADIDREEVKLEDVSPHLVDAVIATEDELFYEHDGVVPKAIMRALFQEFTNAAVQTGGSTLTQQLIKNQILTNEVSFDRKAKEILLALRLEKFFKKDEIIEAYLNVTDFGRNSNGRNIAGVQAAAKGIFGVEAKDLNIPQSAFIAGLPQSPFGYTPFSNDGGTVKENLNPGINRMKTVLNRMYSGGYITKAEYEEALSYDLRANLTPKKPSSIEQYPFLTYEVEARAKEIIMAQLANKDGYTKEELNKDEELKNQYYALADQAIRHKGYRIHTTINKDIYDKMQDVVANYKYYGSDKPENIKDPDTGKTKVIQEPVETGGVLIENNTGRIISFVGGRDFDRENLNHATRAERPNGSTMKPLLVYAPAMELGKSQPGSVIADVPFSLGSWRPQNYGGGYHGLTSARTALKQSYNIPAVKTYLTIMDQKPLSYLEKMGFTTLHEKDYGAPSLSLGGMTIGVTVEENVNAYTTFANKGKFIDAYMIEKIETNDGKMIYQHEKTETDVFSAQTAYLTLDMMRDVISSGTAASLNGYLSFSADWAGKTGTGQDYQDAWFVATNPNVTFGTWIGYDTPKSLEQNYKGMSYSKRNILLWAKLMNAAYDANPELVAPKTRFQRPDGIVSRSYCTLTGELPSELCQKAGLVATDLFNVKYVPRTVDDSLTSGKYVVVKDRAYKVPSSAPAEFVQQGVMLKKEILKKHGISSLGDLKRLLPSSSKLGNLVITEGNEIADNGASPTKVGGISASDSKLSWKANPDNDVIGYRVYAASNYSTNYKKVASVPASNSLAVTVGQSPAAYYVVAVDVAGRESAPSNIIKIGEYAEKKPASVPANTSPANKETKENNKPAPPKKEEPDTKPAPVDTKPAPADNKPSET